MGLGTQRLVPEVIDFLDEETVMKFSEWLGRGCCVMGVALMMLGSFLVPVNAPLWADPGFGGHGYCDGDQTCATRSAVPGGTPTCSQGGNPCTPTSGQSVITRCECESGKDSGTEHLCRCYGYNP